MTARDVLQNGPTLPRELRGTLILGDERLRWRYNHTMARWSALPEKLIVRRVNIRRESRNWRRRHGLNVVAGRH